MLTKVQSNLTKVQKKYVEAVSEGVENALTAKDIALLIEVSPTASYAMLGDLFDAGLVERVGRGGKWDPYRYFKIKTKHPAVGTAVVPDPTWNVENSDAVSKVAEMLNDFKALFEERNLLREENKKLKTRLENVEKALLD
jgi:DNA-binding transcriptional ArsR family regulator